ncbi:MAG TPA: beta-N-acetylhexosaminidase [Planctomycetota bacterium]|nr:beta-N-acetylhexosaminidase [Planctomycetota bacterium]
MPSSVYALNHSAAPSELQQGLADIQSDRRECFSSSGTKLNFVKNSDGARKLDVRRENDAITIRYGTKTDAFRALGRLMGAPDAKAQTFSETCRFDLFGVMIDVSRNGVLRVDAAKSLLRRFALMGLNMCLLYSEDTYEVPGEPFFGYLRGRYTEDELREIDTYAGALGIEMFPCIQALAHLEQILQWPPYHDYKDVNGVLLAEEDRTIALLDKMITAASKPFRSKRIHVGMDEAHGIGTGRYKERHGEKPPFEILNGHLKRVRDICRAKGLKPMIWSDMYFRLGSKSHDYYDKEWSIPESVVKDIPKDVELVYWDYYHCDQAFYEEWIERHRKLGSEPLMAGGVWTWNRLWPSLPYTITTTNACMKACKAKGLKQVFATMWGDDGMETDVTMALAGVQYFAEHGYADSIDEKLLSDNYRGTCGGEYQDFVEACKMDAVPGVAKPEESSNNIHKVLLWQDPLLAIADPQFEISPRAHYAELTKKLSAAASKPGNELIGFAAVLTRVLELKVDLRRDLAAAYRGGDKKKLAAIQSGDLKALRAEVEKLWKLHRQRWMAVYKPFGWEVIENRYGGLRARLETLSERLDAFVTGTLPKMEEFEADLVRALPQNLDGLPNLNHSRLKTASEIK